MHIVQSLGATQFTQWLKIPLKTGHMNLAENITYWAVAEQLGNSIYNVHDINISQPTMDNKID